MKLKYRCQSCDELFEAERKGRNYPRKCAPCVMNKARANHVAYNRKRKPNVIITTED